MNNPPNKETPLQRAKRAGLPYVEIVVDYRHIKDGTEAGGRIAIRTPATHGQADAVRDLINRLIHDEERPGVECQSESEVKP
jgi:hypothetical protein